MFWFNCFLLQFGYLIIFAVRFDIQTIYSRKLQVLHVNQTIYCERQWVMSMHANKPALKGAYTCQLFIQILLLIKTTSFINVVTSPPIFRNNCFFVLNKVNIKVWQYIIVKPLHVHGIILQPWAFVCFLTFRLQLFIVNSLSIISLVVSD